MMVTILDHLRQEAADSPQAAVYLPDKSHHEEVNHARSRAFIHLFLKVAFGILEFRTREELVTDGRYDGGVDAYYVDRENRCIYFIQAKWRTTEENFRSKTISSNELLVMDISRILDGESSDERGQPYNDHIHAMQKHIAAIDDIGRYKYKVMLLANVPDITPAKLKQLTGGFAADVINHERAYFDLVFPIISGTYFCATDLHIAIDLSNKNAGSKISYQVSTTYSDCEITALFVPTIEVARLMQRYKNSILRFNPRSYLEFEGHKVNSSIRETILDTNTNEFALFNNGITMLSDETNINEKIGQRNKAQLTLKNPQIINGGQTAYTLSRILEEASGDPAPLFQGKEVLVKVITLIEEGDRTQATPEQRLDLIDRISNATNQQTPVITADKFSNDKDHLEIQKVLFDRYGILYERKRGEFADGVNKGYITGDIIVERNLYFRLYYAVTGDFKTAIQKKLFVKVTDPLKTVADPLVLDKLYFALLCYKILEHEFGGTARWSRNKNLYVKLFALAIKRPWHLHEYPRAAQNAVTALDEKWRIFAKLAMSERQEFWRMHRHPIGNEQKFFDMGRWITSAGFAEDVAALFPSELQISDAAASTSDTIDDVDTSI